MKSFLQMSWCLVVLVAGAVPMPAAQVDKFLPNDSELVLTVNVRQVIDSPLVKKYALAQVQAALKKNGQVTDALQAIGFDPLKDVTSITAAGPNLQNADKGLVVVHGKFDLAKFKAKAEEAAKAQETILKIVNVGDYTLYEVHDPKERTKKPVIVGLINEETIVASHAKQYVIEALDKQAGKKESAVNKEVRGLVEKVDGEPSLWAVVPMAAVARAIPNRNEEINDTLDKCNSITLQVRVADDVNTELTVAAKNAAAAQAISGKLGDALEQGKQLLGLVVQQKKELEVLVDVLETVKVGSKGAKVSVKAQLDADVVERALKKN